VFGGKIIERQRRELLPQLLDTPARIRSMNRVGSLDTEQQFAHHHRTQHDIGLRLSLNPRNNLRLILSQPANAGALPKNTPSAQNLGLLPKNPVLQFRK